MDDGFLSSLEEKIAQQEAAGAPRFKLVRFKDITVSTTAAYLVRHIIPRVGLVVIWGPPKCGKSFWTLDTVMHIALGWEYRGHRVRQGTVVYVACEGAEGLGARVEAFRRHKLAGDESDVPFHLVTTRLDLVADCEQLIADIRAQLGGEQPAVITIDTLNRSIPGDESSGLDMSAYVKAADAVREAFNCAVVIIHHCGIDDKRPRGHTSLTGAADTQIAIRQSEDGIVTSVVEWMKDGAGGAETSSRLEVVHLGLDENGDPINSCIIAATDEQAGAPKRGEKKKLTNPQKIALDELQKAIDRAGETPPACTHIPASARAIKEELWRQHCYSARISKSKEPDAIRKAFERAAESLQALQVVGVWEKWVWIVQ
jgi:hypothetical protein